MVYILMANGFEETELIVPLDILRRGGLSVSLVGIEGDYAKSSRGVKIHSDVQMHELDFLDMEMLVLPGGQPGVDHLWEDTGVRDLIIKASEQNIPIGAICAAPMLLGRLGLLKDKNVTCYPGCEGDIPGAHIQDASVVTGENIITARGAGAAFCFGLVLLSVLKGEKIASQVAKSMQYKGDFHG